MNNLIRKYISLILVVAITLSGTFFAYGESFSSEQSQICITSDEYATVNAGVDLNVYWEPIRGADYYFLNLSKNSDGVSSWVWGDEVGWTMGKNEYCLTVPGSQLLYGEYTLTLSAWSNYGTGYSEEISEYITMLVIDPDTVSVLTDDLDGIDIADQDHSKEEYTYNIINGEAVITDYTGSDSIVFIPETLGDAPVTVIGEYAFGWSDIESVIFPYTMRELQHGAFNSCYRLTDVQMNEGLQVIGSNAFLGCESLESLYIPATVTDIGDFSIGYTWINSANYKDESTLAQLLDYNIRSDFWGEERLACFLTIYGIQESIAEKYANSNRITFVDNNRNDRATDNNVTTESHFAQKNMQSYIDHHLTFVTDERGMYDLVGLDGGFATQLRKTYIDSIGYYADTVWDGIQTSATFLSGSLPEYLDLYDVIIHDIALYTFQDFYSAENIKMIQEDFWGEMIAATSDVVGDEAFLLEVLLDALKGGTGAQKTLTNFDFGQLASQAGKKASDWLDEISTAVNLMCKFADVSDSMFVSDEEFANAVLYLVAHQELYERYRSVIEGLLIVLYEDQAAESFQEKADLAEALIRLLEYSNISNETFEQMLIDKLHDDMKEEYEISYDNVVLFIASEVAKDMLKGIDDVKYVIQSIVAGTNIGEQLTKNGQYNDHMAMIACYGLLSEYLGMVVEDAEEALIADPTYEHACEFHDAYELYHKIQKMVAEKHLLPALECLKQGDINVSKLPTGLPFTNTMWYLLFQNFAQDQQINIDIVKNWLAQWDAVLCCPEGIGIIGGDNYTWILEPSIYASDIQPIDNRDGFVFNPSIAQHQPYSVVYENGKAGLIDYDGIIHAPAEYDAILFDEYEDGYLLCKKDEYGEYYSDHEYWIYDGSGMYISDAPDLVDGVYLNDKFVYDDGQLYFVYAGEVTPYSYSDDGEADPYAYIIQSELREQDGEVRAGGSYGLYWSGSVCVEPIYSDARYSGDEYHDIYTFELNGKWGYYDKYGNEIIPPICNAVWSTSNAYLDERNLFLPYDISEGYIAVNTDNGAGYYDIYGNVAVPLIFEETRPVSNGNAWVKQNGRWGVIHIHSESVAGNYNAEYDPENNYVDGEPIGNYTEEYDSENNYVDGELSGFVRYADLDGDGEEEVITISSVEEDEQIFWYLGVYESDYEFIHEYLIGDYLAGEYDEWFMKYSLGVYFIPNLDRINLLIEEQTIIGDAFVLRFSLLGYEDGRWNEEKSIINPGYSDMHELRAVTEPQGTESVIFQYEGWDRLMQAEQNAILQNYFQQEGIILQYGSDYFYEVVSHGQCIWRHSLLNGEENTFDEEAQSDNSHYNSTHEDINVPSNDYTLYVVGTDGSSNIRTGPGLDYEAIGVLEYNDKAIYLNESPMDDRNVYWYKIDLNGLVGWVSEKYTTIVPEEN